MGFSGVIAIDGPSGTGKSTVARGVAVRLGVRYLDTGAMYRAATVAVLRAGIDVHDADQVARVVAEHVIEVGTDPRDSWTRLDGLNVDAQIRDADTTAAVSPVSAVPAVRRQLTANQRAIIEGGSIVAEGRDVGSVVWPDADIKLYLTASEAARARRRAGEIAGADVADVAAALRRRDQFDSTRAVSPLHRPDGATEVDTTDLSVDEVITLLTQLASRGAQVAHRG